MTNSKRTFPETDEKIKNEKPRDLFNPWKTDFLPLLPFFFSAGLTLRKVTSGPCKIYNGFGTGHNSYFIFEMVSQSDFTHTKFSVLFLK